MFHGRPKPIANVLSELMARRGYARLQTGSRCADAWRDAAGQPLAARSRAGQVRRGVLEVFVVSSVQMQELSFQKADLIKRLASLVPEEKITDLRFRVGPIE